MTHGRPHAQVIWRNQWGVTRQLMVLIFGSCRPLVGGRRPPTAAAINRSPTNYGQCRPLSRAGFDGQSGRRDAVESRSPEIRMTSRARCSLPVWCRCRTLPGMSMSACLREAQNNRGSTLSGNPDYHPDTESGITSGSIPIVNHALTVRKATRLQNLSIQSEHTKIR